MVFDSGCERRERVEEGEEEEEVVAVVEAEEERWRVEAEILRAECNFLRMEREVAVKKLEKSRVHMESALRSAVQTIISVSFLSSSSSSFSLSLSGSIGSVWFLRKCRET